MAAKPIIGVTMGDPAGIGPEIVAKSLNEDIYEDCCPIVIGSVEAMKKAVEILGTNQKICIVEEPAEAEYRKGVINIIHIPLEYEFEPGVMNVGNGAAAIKYMEEAYKLIATGKIDGTASAPCNKEAMKMAGLPCVGATEFFAKLAGIPKSFTVIDQVGCYIFQATAHISLKGAIERLTKEYITQNLIVYYKTLQQWGIQAPKLALSGFNPHSSDGGTMGREDLDILTPAIAEAEKELGIQIAGPIPADALYIKGMQHVYDGIVFLFHDTANIPVKLMEQYFPSVVITGGLPFVRTTVAHGTAYDIAYKGIAGHSQMKNAIMAAARIGARIIGTK